MRSKAERMANAGAKKRGKNIELYQVVTIEEAMTMNLSGGKAATVLVKIAGIEANCRDIEDVMAVMVEEDITGVIIPVRRAGDTIERAIQTVAAFVTPKSRNDCSEVAAKGKGKDDD